MTNTKNNKVNQENTNQENNVESKTEKEQELELKNQKLEKEILELKNMFQTFMQQNQQMQQKVEEVEKKTTNISLYQTEEERLDIDPKQLIKIVSLTNGGLSLRTNNVHPLRLNDFGSVRTVTFDDLRVIADYNPNATREGRFLILNEKAVKALYLEKEYEKMINHETIDNIMSLNNEEIKRIFDTVSKPLKQTIVERVLAGIVNGDSKYQDRNKINFIGELASKNLYQIAAEIEERKK